VTDWFVYDKYDSRPIYGYHCEVCGCPFGDNPAFCELCGVPLFDPEETLPDEDLFI